MNQASKAKALADIEKRIEALTRNYSAMTRQKVAEMKEIQQFNDRVEVIGLRKIDVNDVEQVGNKLNQEVRKRQTQWK